MNPFAFPTGKQVETEDDVLHIQELPDFGGRIAKRDSELLVQYLLVPYLRIPLVITSSPWGGGDNTGTRRRTRSSGGRTPPAVGSP